MATLGDHLAYYPDRLEDFETYNQIWNAKQEMRELRYDQPRKNNTYFNHQRVLQIYAAPQTGIKRIYVKASPGVGKTCMTVGMSETWNELIHLYEPDEEGIIREKNYKTLILAKNSLAVSSIFNKDIIETCTDNVYMSKEVMEKKKGREYESAKTKAVNVNYNITTHNKFAREVSKKNLFDLRKTYSHRRIVIDEVHELSSIISLDQNNDLISSKKQIYKPLYEFMNNVFGCSVIMVTATPIVNVVQDFVSVINLLLPHEERINPDEFKEIITGNDLDRIKRDLERLLVPRLMGRVSNIEASTQDKKTIIRSNENIKEIYPPGQSRKSDKALWLTILDSEDSPNNRYKIDFSYISRKLLEGTFNIISEYNDADFYEENENSVKKSNAFWSRSSQLDNIVWPDGNYGSSSMKRWIDVNPATDRTEFTREFIEVFDHFLDQAREDFALSMEKEGQPKIAEKFRNRKGIKIKEISFEKGVKDSDQDLDLDIYAILRVIRSRFSPQNAEIIEQTLGIEYFNEEKGIWEYSLSTKNLRDAHNQECAYIFNGLYSIGGLKDGLFYEFFGFERYLPRSSPLDAKGNISIEKGKRYAIFYSGNSSRKGDDDMDDEEIIGGSSISTIEKMTVKTHGRWVLELFNHPDNKHGEYLKIFIGIKVSAQGINLLNVRQSHHASRQWNEARDEQAETRADRPGSSHAAFFDYDIIQGDLGPNQGYGINYGNGKKTRVQIGVAEYNGVKTRKYVKLFRHAVYNKMAFDYAHQLYPNQKIDLNAVSLGINMYEKAEIKYRKTKLALQIMEKCSFDLRISNDPRYTKSGNLVPYGWDESKELPVDYSTYNLFYAYNHLEDIKKRVRAHFQTNYRATLLDLLAINTQYHQSTVIKAITQIIKDQEPMVDRSGNINYLQEQYDIFFLVKSLSSVVKRTSNLMNYYCEYTHLRSRKNFQELLIENIEDRIIKELNFMMSQSEEKVIISRIRNLYFMQKQVLFEMVVEHYSSLAQDNLINENLFNIIKTVLGSYICYASENQIIFHILYNQSKFEPSGRSQGHRVIASNDYRDIRIFRLDERKWRFATINEGNNYMPLIKGYIKEREHRLWENKNYPFVGTSDRNSVYKGNLYHAFLIQSRKFYNISTSRVNTDKNQSVTEKSAKIRGTEQNSVSTELLIFSILSVEIDMYCLLVVYGGPISGFGVQSKPFIMHRLRKESSNYQGSDKIEYQGMVFSLYKQATADGNYYYHRFVYSDGNTENVFLPGAIMGSSIIHFRYPHPSIMAWLFEEEIEEKVEILAPEDENKNKNELFYPGLKSNGMQYFYLPPYREGHNKYYAMMDVLPHEIMKMIIDYTESKPVVGEIYAKNGIVWPVRNNSLIIKAALRLPEYLKPLSPDPRIISEQAATHGKKNTVITQSMDPVDYEAWSLLQQKNKLLRVIVYLVLYFSERIIEHD